MAGGAPSRPDIFLSYAREDEARARELATALDQRGFSVFWDREVPPGQTWHSYIGEALVNSRCVVVAWSRHSIASQWVLEEASEGKDRNVLVPVLFEPVPPPFGFRAIQAANLTDWRRGRSSAAFEGLVGAVKRIVGGQAGSGTEAEAGRPTPAQPAPPEPAPSPKSSLRPATPPAASSEFGARPLRAADGQTGAWSRWTVLAMAVGFVALAAAGGSAILWWLTPRQGISIEAAWTAIRAASETGEPREQIRDCPECPEMVLVPAGEFTMGSPPDEGGRDDDEGPQRTVAIAEPIWVGKYEVTFAEWDACAAAAGCSIKPDDEGWGRDNRPVINVSWTEVTAYVDWLSSHTGKEYRLLSEAEWEYVARAGSTTAYWWGDDVGRNNANCDGCGSEWDNRKTAPVGSFKANDFGLYDTAGNVWEWVQDCYRDSYDGAPKDASAWKDGDECWRVIRGGSWDYEPIFVRSADRNRYYPDNRGYGGGFRVVRMPD